MHYVYAKIPVHPHDSTDHRPLHERLDEALSYQGLGSVLGWGASLRQPDDAPDAAHTAFHRIDIETSQLDAVLVVLQHTLTDLRVPEGAELHAPDKGENWVMHLTPAGWKVLAQGR